MQRRCASPSVRSNEAGNLKLGVGYGAAQRGSAKAEPVAVENVMDGLGCEDGTDDFHATGTF
jgi:hypothetical protein